MNSLDGSIAGLLLDVALKSTLLLALGLVLVQLYARGSARLRLRLLLTALVGVVALPFLAVLLPSWSLPLLPDPLDRFASPAGQELVVSGSHPGTAPEHVSSATVPLGRSSRSMLWATPPSPASTDTTPKTASIPAAAHSPRLGTARSTSPAAATAIVAILFAIWTVGVAWSLFRQRLAHQRVRQLERRARVEVDDGALAALEGAAARVGVERTVQLLSSDRVTSPMTWGHRYPVVMLPSDHFDWSDERREVVLHHELVHVRRSDWLVRVFARAACALYWFHPLAWMTLSRLVEEQERACDEQVLALGTRASSYAHHLLALARRDEHADAPAIPLPALPMARRPQLEVRLMSILRASNDKSPLRRAVLTLPALLVLTGLVPVLATVQPWTAQTETQASTQSTSVTREQALEELTAVAREIEQLEEALAPHEARLEAIEAELEPTEELLEQVEVSLEPYERQLEAIELELEPLEAELEAIESRLEPHEGLLEEVEVSLEPYEVRLEEIEAGLEPFEAELETLEARMEPFEARMMEAEASYRAQSEQLEATLAELEQEERQELDSAQREELERALEDLHRQLEPFHEQMEQFQSEMQPLFEEMQKIHQQMQPVHDQMQDIHSEMEPTFDHMREVHAQMEPVFEEMRAIQEQMQPMHERMRDVHREMEPVMERMRDIQVDMEPVHERMRDVHLEMESVHEEMAGLHERIEKSSQMFIEATLREELTPLDVDESTLAAAGEAVRDSVHLNVHDNRLRLRGSVPEVKDAIREALQEGGVTSSGLDAASERAARALLELDISLE